MVPGPDIIGSIEDQLTGLRSRAVRREGFVSMMRNARKSESNGSNSSSESNGEKEEEDSSRGSSSGNTVAV